MKILKFAISISITIVLIIILGTRALLPAPLAALLSPQQGLWQNAEPIGIDYSEELSFPSLKGKTNVYIDERLVPHVFAEKEEDAYFVQGYLHARFRLWQMEFETYAAAGRLSEVLGAKTGALDVVNRVDRYFRRLGMGYAAEKALKEIESDSATKVMCDAYTAGVNSYISSLTVGQLPIEYKLMGFRPEAWTNLKTALFVKYMAFELAAREHDFEYTAARNALTKLDYSLVNPIWPDSLDPIVPKGTLYDKPGVVVTAPSTVDSLYLLFNKDSASFPETPIKPDKDNGSNNWAVAGKKTRSGYPILCNDPHLGLNLPSLWFEMQIQTPSYNAYGVSFPCAPGIIIGFNDSCAFGVTNAERDVLDYYEIRFKDDSRSSYWFNGEWKNCDQRIERIKVKGKADVLDTVCYTVFGPVMFDNTYEGRGSNGKAYAIRWKAHDPSNEMKMFWQMDRAKNYNDYLEAIKNLHAPGQNCVFAAKNGDIAIWCQGEFPAKWKYQGDFVMPGTDSSYMWQGMIPQSENPHLINPERGFVSSANQDPADSAYPYYLGNGYPAYRGWTINKRLSAMADITPKDMMGLQTDNYNVFAEMARPVLERNMDESKLSATEKKYWQQFKDWNLRSDTGEVAPTVFEIFWNELEKQVWSDEMAQMKISLMPYESTLLEGLLRDSSFKFADNIKTPQKETVADVVLAAFKSAVPLLEKAEQENRISWSVYKGTHLTHLSKLPAFSEYKLPIGGGTHIINAARGDHGPSWRMVVSLTPQTEAWGVYPGGQNGNPGSVYYNQFADTWANGKYYPLWVMKAGEESDKRVKFRMSFDKQ